MCNSSFLNPSPSMSRRRRRQTTPCKLYGASVKDSVHSSVDKVLQVSLFDLVDALVLFVADASARF